MKKVLILANDATNLYKLRKEIIVGLINKGYEVYVALGNDDSVEKLVSLGCKFIEIDVDRRGLNIVKDIKLFLRYVKLVKDINPDLVMTYAIKPNIYGGMTARLLKKKYIINITGIGTAFQKENMLKKIVTLLYRISAKNAVVFYQNQENKSIFLKNNIVGTKEILVPGSGVNLEQFTYCEVADTKHDKFLFIARVMEEKGVDEFLYTSKMLHKKYHEVEFHIIGDIEEDRYESILKEYIDAGIIHYHGYTENVHDFIRNSTCVVLPSYHEGMSNALLESAAIGRPLIASNISGCIEIIEDGVNGYLVEPKDKESLLLGVEKFIALPRETKELMGKAGRKKIEKEFNRKIIVDAYTKCIDGLTGGTKND